MEHTVVSEYVEIGAPRAARTGSARPNGTARQRRSRTYAFSRPGTAGWGKAQQLRARPGAAFRAGASRAR